MDYRLFVTDGVWVTAIRQTEHVAGVPATAKQGETASGAQQRGMSAGELLCHRLSSFSNCEKQINFSL